MKREPVTIDGATGHVLPPARKAPKKVNGKRRNRVEEIPIPDGIAAFHSAMGFAAKIFGGR